MARIRITLDGDCLCVHIAGRLTATDLRRLEHACSPALTTDRVRIELQVGCVTAMDPAAAAFVNRMTERGATIAGAKPGDGPRANDPDTDGADRHGGTAHSSEQSRGNEESSIDALAAVRDRRRRPT